MILLIGYGNTLRRDDGAGPVLVQEVARRCPRDDLKVITCHQLTPELACELAEPEVRAAIFADASVDGGDGEGPLLRTLQVVPGTGGSGHDLGAGELLGLAGRLFGYCPPAWLAAVPGEDFAFGEGLGPRCQRYLEQATEEVLGLIRSLDCGKEEAEIKP